MTKLSRGAWFALAAVIAIPGTYAIAKTYERSGWQRMSPETRARLDEGRLAMAKTALKLTPDQDKLWLSVEAEVRNEFKARQDKMAERQKMREERKAKRQAAKADGAKGDAAKSDANKDQNDKASAQKRGDMAERFDKMSADLSQRADRLKAFSAAFKPFYVSLSDEQKDVLRPLMRDLAPGFGGPRGKGNRMAQGSGWGGDKGHGKWHDGWKKGGKNSDDRAADNDDSASESANDADTPAPTTPPQP